MTIWSDILAAAESRFGSCDVTRRALSLGSRDAERGWRAKTYNETTVHMVLAFRGSPQTFYVPGAYVRRDALGLTDTAFVEGDQVKDADNVYYEVKAVTKHKVGTTTACYACDLDEVPMWQAPPGTITHSKTRPRDPRYRTKYWIDQRARASQITKDNDSTQASWAAIWADPPYPLSREFRAASSAVQGLYTIAHANSTALIDLDLTPHGYKEHVPIHICTVDSTGCTGNALNWKMEAEVRYICENYSTGSQRRLDFVRSNDRQIGNMWLYDREFIMAYRRGIS